ncbi:hypothetical protein DYU11_28620 [Fibrisoma montanum]|uniref:Uncharacterized protein n=1 Tax=Fibrisoma montanum TaxID=2305895 RepID=A0A418LYZ8_9BACT|nr:hypothetical protein [Fibrisoma montanum]RIV18538.1 hypothetical protein DYU11_28620 [Fibrisoma montanum]
MSVTAFCVPYCRFYFSILFLVTFLLTGPSGQAQTPMPTRLTHRVLSGYAVSTDAPVNKGKPTLFVFEQTDTFKAVFQPASGQRQSAPNFNREMVVGVVLPPSAKSPKLTVSRVFVMDSVLTFRYIKQTDTSKTASAQPTTATPMLLVAIPKQTVLSARLIENGRLVQTIKRREGDDK